MGFDEDKDSLLEYNLTREPRAPVLRHKMPVWQSTFEKRSLIGRNSTRGYPEDPVKPEVQRVEM